MLENYFDVTIGRQPVYLFSDFIKRPFYILWSKQQRWQRGGQPWRTPAQSTQEEQYLTTRYQQSNKHASTSEDIIKSWSPWSKEPKDSRGEQRGPVDYNRNVLEN